MSDRKWRSLAWAKLIANPWIAAPFLGALGFGLNKATAIVADSIFLDLRPVGYLEALNQPLFWVFLQFVIFGPLYETFIAQWIIFEVLRMRGDRTGFFIPLSAAFFGAGHWLSSSPAHAFVATLFGIYLAVIYRFVDRNCPGVSPFMTTWAVHASNNLIALAVIIAA